MVHTNPAFIPEPVGVVVFIEGWLEQSEIHRSAESSLSDRGCRIEMIIQELFEVLLPDTIFRRVHTDSWVELDWLGGLINWVFDCLMNRIIVAEKVS